MPNQWMKSTKFGVITRTSVNTSPKRQNAMASRWRLDGKRIVVTGGTKGIGKAVVEECASLGATVFTCGRSEETIDACVTEWSNKGLNVIVISADLVENAGRLSFYEFVVSNLNGQSLHGLVNNVGTNIRKKAVDYSEEEYNTVLRTNLDSAFRLSTLFYPLLKASSGSAVVNIGSVAGFTQFLQFLIFG